MGLMAFLPKTVIERIATLRISMGTEGNGPDRMDGEVVLQLEPAKDSLALSNEFKGLKEVQPVVWMGDQWVTTSDQRRDKNKAIKECTYKDVEVV